MDTDSLALISAFVRVARCMSFSGAAAELRLSTGTVSRQIARLEKRMGVQLLERSTRRVALTEIGKTFYASASRILLLAEEAMSRVQDLQAEPRGTLRLTAPMLFGIKHLGPLISRFTERHPHVEVLLKISDQLESLSGGDFDIAVRITNHLDDGLVARRLTGIHWAVCASPGYLARHGTPEAPADLARHRCLTFGNSGNQSRGWQFVVDGALLSMRLSGPMECSDGAVLHEWALAGHGVAWRSMWEVADDIAAGRLVALLEAFAAPDTAIHAVFPQRRHLPLRVRMFVDYLKHTYGSPDYWRGLG